MNARAAALLAFAMATGCVGHEQNERVRFGFGVGHGYTLHHVDREGVSDVDPRFEAGDSATGHIEAAFVGADPLASEVRLRAFGLHDEVRLEGSTGTAEFTEAAMLLLVAPRLPLGQAVVLSPLLGPGLGYADVEVPAGLGIGSASGASASFALGAELEFAGHATFGVLAVLTVIGAPGDTTGDTEFACCYVGLRF